MIHALGESIVPAKLAFQEEFPEAELVNVMDEGLFIDFDMQITPKLRRRMSELICYCAEHGSSATSARAPSPMTAVVTRLVSPNRYHCRC